MAEKNVRSLKAETNVSYENRMAAGHAKYLLLSLSFFFDALKPPGCCFSLRGFSEKPILLQRNLITETANEPIEAHRR